jgi:hypothetical protein
MVILGRHPSTGSGAVRLGARRFHLRSAWSKVAEQKLYSFRITVIAQHTE